MKVIMERYPYRYVETGTLDNGFPDYRIQKQDYYTKRYKDMYLCDNGMQKRRLNISKSHHTQSEPSKTQAKYECL